MVSKIRLPELQPREEAAVTSSVVDVFYTPRKQPVSNVVGDIARSLGSIVPALQQYENVKEEVVKSEQEAKADKDFLMENKRDFKSLVKDGTIREGANPYYVKRYVTNSLRETARTFERELFEAYRKNNLDTDSNPSAFVEFYKKFSSDFRDKNNLGAYSAETLAQGFIPYAEATRSNLANRHQEQRIANIEKEQVRTLNDFVEGELLPVVDIPEEDLDRALANFNIDGAGLNYLQKEILYKAQLFQKEIDEMIVEGMDAAVANKTVVDAIINTAKLTKDESLLTILDNIITDKDSGSRLAGTFRSEITDALTDIAQLKDTEFLNNQRIKREIADQRKLDTLNYFIKNKTMLLDIEQGIKQYNLFITFENERTGGNAPPLDVNEEMALRELSQKYISGLQKENIILDDTGRAFVKELSFLLANDPSNPKIADMIERGWGVYFTTSEGQSYLSTYTSRRKLDGSIYTTDQRYSQVFDSINKPLQAFAKTPGGALEADLAELQSVGNTQLLDFFYGILEDFQDENFLKQQGLITENQKKKYLFKEMREEAARILDIIVPASDRGGFNPSRADTELKIGEITENPYE